MAASFYIVFLVKHIIFASPIFFLRCSWEDPRSVSPESYVGDTFVVILPFKGVGLGVLSLLEGCEGGAVLHLSHQRQRVSAVWCNRDSA
jgi:hypothetical protein